MALGKKTGGRTKGTPNKRTVVERLEMEAAGEMPLAYMLRVMRDQSVDHDRRDRMAVAVANFVHAKLQSTTLQGDKDMPLVHEIVQRIVDPKND